MVSLQLNLSPEERAFLASLLENLLKDKRVEEHRTRVPSYREQVSHEKDLLIALLEKLGHPTDTVSSVSKA